MRLVFVLIRLPLDGEGGPLAVDEVIFAIVQLPSSAPSGHLPHKGEGLVSSLLRLPLNGEGGPLAVDEVISLPHLHPSSVTRLTPRDTFPTRGKACCGFFTYYGAWQNHAFA